MRAFIAVKVQATPEIVKLISEIDKTGCVNAVKPENLHICIEFLGEVEEPQVETLKKILDSVAGSGKFEIKLKNVGAFPNENFVRVLWIGAESEKLTELALKLKEKLQKIGFGKEKFTPHITLARVKRRMEGGFVCEKEFGGQLVGKVYLIASELTSGGPAYRDVYEIEL